MSLNGKHALITGGSRGIGRGIALKLAEKGAKVAVHYYQNEAAANDTLAQVRERGSEGFVTQADVSKSGLASTWKTAALHSVCRTTKSAKSATAPLLRFRRTTTWWITSEPWTPIWISALGSIAPLPTRTCRWQRVFQP